MSETRFKLQVVLVVLSLVFRSLYAINDDLLFAATRAPRYFGVQHEQVGPLSVERSIEYTDQDYIATNRKRHKIDWNKNPQDMEDFDDEDTEETVDEKEKDVKIPTNLQARPL